MHILKPYSMRKGITSLFFVLAIASVCTPTTLLHAQTGTAPAATTPTATDAAASAASAAAGTTNSNQPSTQAGGAAPKNAAGESAGFPTRLGQYIGNLMLNLASSVTWMGGKLLEGSMQWLIFEMGALTNSGSALGMVIDNLWKVIRDICNLAFIFGFIYIGIRTILDNENAETKRMLAQIIIAALLINFSLFFTKAIIEFSNVLAYEIKQTMISGSGTISAHFGNILGISSIYDTPKNDVFPNLTLGGNIWFYFMGSLLLLVAGFVLAAGGILVIVRFVMLVLIMIASPILFGATIFPNTSHYAKMLWLKLISYSFFAPAYLFVLLLSMHVLTGIMNMLNPGRTATLSGALTNSSSQGFDSFNVVVLFSIAIVFMIASLQVAQRMGTIGADKALSIGKDLRGRGQRALGSATLGTVGALGRSTVGRIGNKFANDGELKDKAATNWVAKQQLKLANAAADSSFDARKVGGVGKKLGIGEGRNGGYKTVQEEITKKEKDFGQNVLGEVGDDDVRVQARKKEWEAAQKTQKAETESLRKRLRELPERDVDGRADLQDQIDKLEKDAKDAQIAYEKEKQRRIIGSTYSTPETPKDNADLEEIKRDITDKKIAIQREWKGDNNGYLSYKGLSGLNNPEVEQAKRRDKIAQLNKELADLEKKQYEHLTRTVKDRGYAGTLENRSEFKFISTWLKGRLVHNEHEAGKATRKSAEKGLPKKKDE